MTTFEECRSAVEVQVDGPREENGALKSNFVERIADLYDANLFFVRRGRALHKRARSIHDLARELADKDYFPRADLPGRNDLEALGRKDPVTLFVALRLGRFFGHVYASGTPELQELCRYRAPDGDARLFSVGANDIIPSCYQAKPGEITRLREQFGLKKVRLGKILFGENGDELIDLHESAKPPCVTYYFASEVHTRLVGWVKGQSPDFDEFEDPTDLFKRVTPAPKLVALRAANGNVVPD